MGNGEFKAGAIGLSPVLVASFLGLFAYLPSIFGEFVWDDWLIVKQNPLVLGTKSVVDVVLSEEFPLTMLVFGLLYSIWGDSSWGYHLVSVVLHIMTSIVTWRLGVRLGIRGAFLGACLWLVHPLCVASVAWISELKNVLSGFFAFLSAFYFVSTGSYTESTRRAGIRWFYVISFFCFVLALLAKTAVVMLPVCFLGYLWLRVGRLTRDVVLDCLPFFVASLLLGLRTIALYNAGVTEGLSRTPEDFWSRLAGAGMALWFYLSKALIPLGLCAEYPSWGSESWGVLAFLPLVAWVFVVGFGWLVPVESVRVVVLSLGFFTICLIPVLGVIPMPYQVISPVSDHFVYIPLVGVCFAIAWLIAGCFRGKVREMFAAFVVIFFTSLTAYRSYVYASEERLWKDTISKNPNAWNAHNNLGCVYAQRGLLGRARVHFERSIEINPSNAQARCNLGRLLVESGCIDEGIAQLTAAVRLKPNNADIRLAAGFTLWDLGRVLEAVPHLEVAVRSKPNPEALSLLAQAYYQQGRFEEAVDLLERAIGMSPHDWRLLSDLALILANCPDSGVRDIRRAADLLRKAAAMCNYTNHVVVGNLGLVLARSGEVADACRILEVAVGIAERNGDLQAAQAYRKILIGLKSKEIDEGASR